MSSGERKYKIDKNNKNNKYQNERNICQIKNKKKIIQNLEKQERFRLYILLYKLTFE